MNTPFFFYWTKRTRLTKEMTDAFYKSGYWQKCRGTVLERDGYLCQECIGRGDPIPADTVHHIVHLKDDPSKALEESNLISVCFPCHNDLHPEKGFGISKDITTPKGIKVIEINNNPEKSW